MNQQILINDDIHYDETRQCLIFTAMVSGMLVSCVIATSLTKQQALTHFKAHQFDYEMQAEQLIEEEAYSAQGEIELVQL
ncbi:MULTISPECIES: DUF1488 domain-containing protein [Pseudoalteromonas]|uniref:DUF1488 domain-containing protein n=1 Tax=Pseudoalteromonas TaxID=53246 RepID=UPI001890BA24|nr:MULTISPECIES: DUF1488 domain-containing protein [Pseudoalteromonas]MCG7564430.1 DUF1488 domain-containing protein [Pseudoalteromonas sp. McH1-42]MEC4090366.1 DUF1488 domain-containing protein [Pseudoalteromonas rubra]